MLDRDLLSELQLTLIEPPDGGDTWPSLIWTRDEVLDALNAGVRALARDAHLDVARVELPVAAGALSVPLPADWLASAALVWRATSLSPALVAYRAQVIADGAVSYWPLDESGGTTARDHAGTRHGAITGGVTLGVPGVVPGDGALAMAFDGTGRIDAVPLPGLLPGFSQELWFWASVLPTGTKAAMFCRDNFQDGGTTLDLNYSPPGTLRFYQAGRPQYVTGTIPSSSLGVWHQVIVTGDGTALRMYVDGVLQGTTPSTLVVDSGVLGTTIGADSHSPTECWRDGSRLSDVSYYSTVLTPAQVAAHYALRQGAASSPTQVRTPLGPVDSFEGDLAVPGWETAPGLPLGYADLDQSTLTLRLVPTPALSGILELVYIRVPPLVTGTQPPTLLPVADEFAAGVKYATLATLLRKVGRLIDPERADYCDRRYKLTHTAAAIILEGWA